MTRDSSHRRPIPNLRAWRIYRLLSQDQLAKAAGVGEMTIHRLERGDNANELTVYKLAKGLGLSIQQLLTEAPPEQTVMDETKMDDAA